MNFSITSCFLVSISLLALSACGKDAKDAVDKVANNLENAELIHTWERDSCSSSTVFGASYRTQYIFSGSDVKRVEQYFSAANCVDLAGTISYSGNYQKKDEVQKGVHAFNLTFTNVVVVAANDTGKNLLNVASFCGKTDWVVNQPADLTANARDKLCPVTALPEYVFDLYTVEGKKLFFGKGENKTKSLVEKRPSQIDREASYHQI